MTDARSLGNNSSARLPRLHPIRRWRRGERTLYLRPDTGTWVVTEGVGAEVIDRCDGARSIDSIARELAAAYGAEPETVRVDVARYASELRRIGFLGTSSAAPTRDADGRIDGIALHITAACSLSCRHCYASPAAPFRVDPPIDLLVSAAEQARALGARSFKFTGGDPLARPEVLDALDRPLAGTHVTVLTNGLAPVNRLRALLADGNRRLQISLDGAGASTHDWYRGEGSHARLVRNLDALAASGATQRVSLSVCLSKVNCTEVEVIVQRAIDWGIPHVHLARISRHGQAARHWHALTMSPADWASTYRELARVWRRYHDRLRLTGFLADYLQSCLAHPSLRGCEPGRRLMVDLDGLVYPCIMMGGRETCLGDLRADALAQCIAPERVQPLRNRCAARLAEETVCGECDWRRICSGACPGWCLVQDGTMHRTDDLCEVRRELLPDLIFDLSDRLTTPVGAEAACAQ